MNIDLKEDFQVVEDGTTYLLPCYVVVDGKGIERTQNAVELKFVRGSKLAGEEVPSCEGTLHEHMLAAMIHDLSYKNGLVSSTEGEMTILKLQEALHWLRHRQIDRTKRAVVGTYQK